MTDSSPVKVSAFDHSEDSQDLILTQQEQASVLDHVNTSSSSSGSALQDNLCEDFSQGPHTSGRSSKCFTSLTTVSTSVVLDDSDSESDLPDSAGRLFQPKPPDQSVSTQSSLRHLAKSPANKIDKDASTDSSSDSSSPFKLTKSLGIPTRAFNLKASFDYYFRRKKCMRQVPQSYEEKQKKRKRYKSTGKPTGRPPLTAPLEERKKRLRDRGFQFPFVEKEYGRKHLPMKMVLEYEHAALKGYFQYVEMLKYEEHLKKSLKNLDASEDLENECMTTRKQKYLDDEGPISPIAETHGDDNLDSDQDLGAKIVENSCFILSSKIPCKKKSKTKAKHAKLVRENGHEEEEERVADEPGHLQDILHASEN